MKSYLALFLILISAYFIFPFNADALIMMELIKKRNQGFEELNIKNKVTKILIVPGHDDDDSGSYFNGVNEVELNRELAKNLYEELKKESDINVVLASDENGYANVFKDFFEKKEKDINSFIKEVKSEFKKSVKKGKFILKEEDFHNTASDEISFKLYGMNMWLNENDFDFVFHVHFNDYAGRKRKTTHEYNGFAIYIPDKQFGNYEKSREISEKIFEKMKELSPVSNLKPEKEGIIEDQELIALGSNNALKTASVLIEYGYIYEPQFTHENTRKIVLKDLAHQTYLGIRDFLGKEIVLESDKYIFEKNLENKNSTRDIDNYMLQKVLAINGFYPPKDRTLNDCPISGYFGECTKDAVIDFQKSKGLLSTGYVGKMTREALNSIK